MNVEKILHKDQLLAMIIYSGDIAEGVHFCTSDDNALQVGKHLRREGEVIKPHKHLPVEFAQMTGNMQEVLLVEEGEFKINFRGIMPEAVKVVKGSCLLVEDVDNNIIKIKQYPVTVTEPFTVFG